MSVRVLVSREFKCVTVAEAASQFKSLADAGWDVFVEADGAAASPEPEPKSPPKQRLLRRDASRVISEIIANAGAGVATVANHLGVSEQTVRNWARGVTRPSRKSWPHVKSLHGDIVQSGSTDLADKHRRRQQRAVRTLTQDDMLDIGLRLSAGETITSVAERYEINRHRVKQVARKVGA